MNEEEIKEIYKGLKRNKKIIGTIDKDFFFEFAETVLNLLEKKDICIIEAKEANRQLSIELQKKDKIIDEIQEEVRGHIGFENRLKRDNREPDLFNQGRFYVANNIKNILKGK